jgi:glycosyltransferase involved in cell wall biosynthesis
LLDFLEFYYVSQGADYGFDLEYSETGWEGLARLRMKNANSILNLDSCDWAVSPTEWQASTVPEIYRNKITVVHDGIDTDFVRPDAGAAVRLEKAGVTLTAADEVITFVNRNMEPYRGFHIFMRALPEIQKRRPNAWVLVVGGDDVSYGRKLPPGQSYRKKYMAEVGHLLDMDRIRFVGRVPYADFLRMLQVSRAHVYLTYPFVLSWSMLEAMATGCLLIGSATPPVMEVIEDGVNGLLVDFFSPIGIADAIDRVLDHPDRMQALRNAARQTVIDRYDLKRVCLPRHIALVEGLAAGRIPPLGEAPPAPAAHGGRRTLEDVKRARMMAAMQPGGR